MKIILNEDVEKIGKKGELKEVKPGYARNYLFPKNLAIPATKSAVKKVNEDLKKKESEDTKSKEDAQNKAKILEGYKVTIQAKSEKNGKLFGSIAEKEIVENIKKQTGQNINPNDVEILEPIKKIGNYKANINLHKNVKISIDINIVVAKK
jgi:large subunit ribosomal protein L9